MKLPLYLVALCKFFCMYIERSSFSGASFIEIEVLNGAVLLLPLTTHFLCILQRFEITLLHTNEFMKDHTFESPRKI